MRPLYTLAEPDPGGNLIRGTVGTTWSCLHHGPIQVVTVAWLSLDPEIDSVGWYECPHCLKKNYDGRVDAAQGRG